MENSSGSGSVPAGRRLRDLMDSGCVMMPGAFCGLVALSAARAGFRACYVSGAAASASAGLPDVGLLSLTEFARLVREVAGASGLPVLADADTGFGEAEMVRRTVIEYDRAGAAGLHIEDQEFPKRCGHLDGKRLIPADHMAEKVEWAARAAREADRARGTSAGAFVLCARTDAAGVEGFDAAVRRARMYVEAGADMIFPEGLRSEDEFARFAAGLGRKPGAPGAARGRSPYLLANMTEFGKTPMITASRFAEMGYDAVIYPVTTLRLAMKTIEGALAQLRTEGSAESLLPAMQTRAELYDLLSYSPGTPWPCPVR